MKKSRTPMVQAVKDEDSRVVERRLMGPAGRRRADYRGTDQLLAAGAAVLSGLASLAGYTLFNDLSPEVIAATTALAAGAILVMLVDTMISEAFAVAHNFAGLITVVGFLAAFVLSKLGG